MCTRGVIVMTRPVIVGKQGKTPRQNIRYCVYIKMDREKLEFAHVIYVAYILTLVIVSCKARNECLELIDHLHECQLLCL